MSEDDEFEEQLRVSKKTRRGPEKCLVMRYTNPSVAREFPTEVDSDGSCGNKDRRGVKCARNFCHVDNCMTPDGTWDSGVKCPTCSGKGTVPTP